MSKSIFSFGSVSNTAGLEEWNDSVSSISWTTCSDVLDFEVNLWSLIPTDSGTATNGVEVVVLVSGFHFKGLSNVIVYRIPFADGESITFCLNLPAPVNHL